MSVQHIADGLVSGPPRGPVLTPDIDGQLDGVRYRLRVGPDKQSCALERDQPARHHRDGAVGERSDVVGAVDRGDSDW